MSSDTATLPGTVLSRATVEELSAQRGEPDWLRMLRLRAFDAYERMPLPDQHTEGWRRTSLRGLPLDTFDPLANAPAPVPRQGDNVIDLWEALSDPTLAARIEQHFGRIVAPESDKFSALHYAFFNLGVVILAARNQAIEEPLWITHDGASLVHTLILADEGSDLRVIEEFSGGPAISSGVVEQSLGANANVRYVHVQRLAPDVWNFSWQGAQLREDAWLRTLNVAVGSRMSRNTVQVCLQGARSQADLLGVVETRDRQHIDFQTLQDHSGDNTRSDLVIHDALRDRSSANFTGLIRINPSAHQTESSQEQKNILLSDRAKADSDPKLEILNNDVIRCTHGASVGPVDPESIFYLQSRGVDRRAAEELLVEGFFRSVIDKIGLASVSSAVWRAMGHEAGSE
jgi:Fe-S cluster assembly protein SufD